MLLVITPAGLEAIGVEPDGTETAEAPEAAPESHCATERATDGQNAATAQRSARPVMRTFGSRSTG